MQVHPSALWPVASWRHCTANPTWNWASTRTSTSGVTVKNRKNYWRKAVCCTLEIFPFIQQTDLLPPQQKWWHKTIMDLNKMEKTTCGVCFVEYYSRADAKNAMRYINGIRLNDQIFHTGWATGGQHSRGWSGGHVWDECGQDYDAVGAMENWPKTNEWWEPHHENSLLWPVKFDVHYLRSANLPIFTKLWSLSLLSYKPLHGFPLKIIKERNPKECLYFCCLSHVSGYRNDFFTRSKLYSLATDLIYNVDLSAKNTMLHLGRLEKN